MVKKNKTIVLLSLMMTLCMSISLLAASKKAEPTKKISIQKQQIESFAGGEDEQQHGVNPAASKSLLSPSANSSSLSPGVVIGNTWYDYQHNGSIGRMIDWGNDPDQNGNAIVHFGWMNLPGAVFTSRHYAYTHYDALDGLLGTISAVQPGDEYGGYVNVQSTSDGKAVIGGHNNVGSGNQTHLYYDFTPGFGFWTDNTRIPDSVASYSAVPVQAVIWPKFAYQEGTFDVTHVIAQVSSPSSVGPQAIYYFRKVGTDGAGSWDYPPYIIDTIYDISHDIAASKTSDKVAIVWTANLNYNSNGDQLPIGVCDTCSGTSPYLLQWDNDIYYQTSDDQGLSWNPRINVTKARLGEAGYRAYTDLSALMDSNDDLHVIWNAVPWAVDIENVSIDNSCRLFHYSESVPYIRTIANAEWPIENFDCGPGAWNINISKMQISECDGKFYALWVQFNDLSNGITDDCAARASTAFSGSANGELYIAVSFDGGTTWDTPRNLTNSRTPGCDPAAGGADCESDNWPSMARIGRQNIAGEDWTGAIIVDPSGTYAGDYFLDVQYVHDRDAGGIVQEEGSWQLSNMNWFRLACIEPIPNPQITFTPNNIDLPVWTKPTVGIDLDLTIENIGNVALTYSTVVEEDNGTAGWLAVSGLSGLVPSGLSNIEVGTLHLNNGGVQTTEAGLTGRVIFTSNAPTSPDTLKVFLIVTDTIIEDFPDTLIGYLSLLVKNNGNYGNSGDKRINMDFVTNGADCDTTADVYLYEGSPIILTAKGGDTTAAWSIFGDGWLNTNGFKPQGGQTESVENGYAWYSTGTFTTPDSSVAIEQTFYTPVAIGANYMIKKLKVWSFDGATHNGLRIGDAIDWDIPSDTGALNGATFDVARKLIYQIGSEFHQDDTGANPSCIDSDRRFGGIAFIKSELNGSVLNTFPYSAYTARNDSFVFPNGNFVPGQLWNNMDNSGFAVESDITDIHTVMCYESSLNLGALDTIVFWTALATVYDGTSADLGTAVDNAIAFANNNNYWEPSESCCVGPIRGNVDCSEDDLITISDLLALVCIMFQGCDYCCIDEANINASTGIVPVDISDLVHLISYMFQGGPLPAPCP